MTNKKIAWLRTERGYTMDEMAHKLNAAIGAQPGNKNFQTADKIYTYERTYKPINVKPEVLAAYLEIFNITEDEMLKKDLAKLNLKQRWAGQKNVLQEPAAAYKKEEPNADMQAQLDRIEKKLDALIKLSK